MPINLGEMTEQEVYMLEIQDTYKIFLALCKMEEGKHEKTRKLAENGIKLKFKLYNYLKGHYTEKWKQEIVIIEHKVYKAEDFWNEINERNAIMQNEIVKAMQEEDIIKPR